MSAILRQHWQGVPSEEIAANLDRQCPAAEVGGEVAREQAQLEDNALARTIRRAEQGEVAAVEWLEKRGFIDMPSKRSEQPASARPRIS